MHPGLAVDPGLAGTRAWRWSGPGGGPRPSGGPEPSGGPGPGGGGLNKYANEFHGKIYNVSSCEENKTCIHLYGDFVCSIIMSLTGIYEVNTQF